MELFNNIEIEPKDKSPVIDMFKKCKFIIFPSPNK